nr:GNAT family N-acetyltransferase [Nocardioides sp. GY 10113]
MRAGRGDAEELLTLQRACWVQEALANDLLDIPALHEGLDEVRDWIGTWETYLVRRAGRLVGAVRARLDGEVWEIGRLMVAPDLQGQGLGRALLDHVQAVAPAGATSYALVTGGRSERNLRLYKKAGFRLRRDLAAPVGAVTLTKAR